MTAISTLLSARTIACATDSFLTEADTGKIIEARRPKLISVNALKLVISYWGLARTSSGFDTFEYLRRFSSDHRAAATAQKFCEELCRDLSNKVAAMRLQPPTNGLGVHIAAFEKIDSVFVPELFLCSNFTDTSYSITVPRFSLSRESFKDASFPNPDTPMARAEYHRRLVSGQVSFFNNGDPQLFNPVANAIFEMSMTIRHRHIAKTGSDASFYRHWVCEPIRCIADLQKRLCKPGKRIVGGIVHHVLLHQSGNVECSTGRIPEIH